MTRNNNKNNVKETMTSEDEQKAMEFLKTQDNKVVVIDIPEQEANRNAQKEKKHVNIFKQFLLPRVYVTAIVAFILYIICNLAVNIVISIVFLEDDDDASSTNSSNQEAVEELLKDHRAFMIIYGCIFGPILEEILFRLCIFKPIQLLGKKVEKSSKFFGKLIIFLAFIISSFIFAFGHYDFRISILADEIVTFPTYFLMGVALAAAYNYDGYLSASILMHMLNNTVATVISLTTSIIVVAF